MSNTKNKLKHAFAIYIAAPVVGITTPFLKKASLITGLLFAICSTPLISNSILTTANAFYSHPYFIAALFLSLFISGITIPLCYKLLNTLKKCNPIKSLIELINKTLPNSLISFINFISRAISEITFLLWATGMMILCATPLAAMPICAIEFLANISPMHIGLLGLGGISIPAPIIVFLISNITATLIATILAVPPPATYPQKEKKENEYILNALGMDPSPFIDGLKNGLKTANYIAGEKIYNLNVYKLSNNKDSDLSDTFSKIKDDFISDTKKIFRCS